MGRPRHELAFGAVEQRFGGGHKRVRAWDVVADRVVGTDAPTFVLVHGLGLSSRLFRPTVDRLRHHGRVVVFDLPGFGGVPHPSDPMTIEEFARAIVPALEDLAVRRPVLVGHSMGAQVVVELVRREPSLGGRLVLIAPVVCAHQRSLPQVLLGFVRSAAHERFGAALASVRGYVAGGLRWPLEILPAMVTYPIEERIRGVGGRLVIVRGEHDRLCPAGWADDLLARSGADGGVIVAEGAAHQVVVDDADLVVSAAIAAAGRGPLP